MSADGPADPVKLVIGDTAVARIAATSAAGVPGVLGLRADLGQTLLGVASSVLRQDRSRRPTDGVHAEVHGDSVDVEITLVTTLGHNCRDLAVAVQREVTDGIDALTGLAATVSVTVADVILE